MKRRYILLFLTFVISFQYIKSNTELDSYTYFPEERYSSYLMDYRNYENQIKLRDNYDSDFFPKHPFINFDVIDGDLLKIYIPYFPNQNRPLEEVCPELLTDSLKENQVLSSTLACFNKAYDIFIDGQRISSNFIFYNYPHDLFTLKTCFMVVDIANFSKGLHILKISNNLPALSKAGWEDGKFDVEYNKESTKNHEIPFYISR